MSGEKKEFSFLWYLENFSYHEERALVSPEFTSKGMESSSWSMYLHPSYPDCKKRDLISVHLKRSTHCVGPESLPFKLEISLITLDGATLYSEESEHAFRRGSEREFKPLLDGYKLYELRNLFRDTLGVRCRIWNDQGNVLKVGPSVVRTRILIERISFHHRVENFSALKLNDTKIVHVPSHSRPGCTFSSSLFIAKNSLDCEWVEVRVGSSDRNYRLRNKRISLLDVYGNSLEIGEVDHRFSDEREQTEKLRSSLGKQFILSKGKKYLPNDELSLLCECTFAADQDWKIEVTAQDRKKLCIAQSKNIGAAAENFSEFTSASEDRNVNQDVQHQSKVEFKSKSFPTNTNAPLTRPSKTFKQRIKNDPYKKRYNAAAKLPVCPSFQDDFKELYNAQYFTDIVLKSATKSFPAHKGVLCARSSVFRAMLTTDVREKDTDCIRVEDLDDGTVERLLLFLYSDHLEELFWESALKLYHAADKYAIEKLKVLCATFLVDNINTFNASELLLLADAHNDAELKNFVQDFILKHEDEVFCSDEWERLTETNPLLALKTMKLKYKKKKGGK